MRVIKKRNLFSLAKRGREPEDQKCLRIIEGIGEEEEIFASGKRGSRRGRRPPRITREISDEVNTRKSDHQEAGFKRDTATGVEDVGTRKFGLSRKGK